MWSRFLVEMPNQETRPFRLRRTLHFSPIPKENTHMLIHWQSHQEYLNFLHETKVHLDSSHRTRLQLEFGHVRQKLRLLNLDPVMEYHSASYSPIGRPAKTRLRLSAPHPYGKPGLHQTYPLASETQARQPAWYGDPYPETVFLFHHDQDARLKKRNFIVATPLFGTQFLIRGIILQHCSKVNSVVKVARSSLRFKILLPDSYHDIPGAVPLIGTRYQSKYLLRISSYHLPVLRTAAVPLPVIDTGKVRPIPEIPSAGTGTWTHLTLILPWQFRNRRRRDSGKEQPDAPCSRKERRIHPTSRISHRFSFVTVDHKILPIPNITVPLQEVAPVDVILPLIIPAQIILRIIRTALQDKVVDVGIRNGNPSPDIGILFHNGRKVYEQRAAFFSSRFPRGEGSSGRFSPGKSSFNCSVIRIMIHYFHICFTCCIYLNIIVSGCNYRSIEKYYFLHFF